MKEYEFQCKKCKHKWIELLELFKMSLSDKIRRWMDYKERMLDVEDVKEFIRELLELGDNCEEWRTMRGKIKELVGDKLIK